MNDFIQFFLLLLFLLHFQFESPLFCYYKWKLFSNYNFLFIRSQALTIKVIAQRGTKWCFKKRKKTSTKNTLSLMFSTKIMHQFYLTTHKKDADEKCVVRMHFARAWAWAKFLWVSKSFRFALCCQYNERLYGFSILVLNRMLRTVHGNSIAFVSHNPSTVFNKYSTG